MKKSITYTTFTTDTDKKDFDKALSKIALPMFDYLFTVENNGKKEIVPHSSGDISKKILMTKDKKGLLNETRLNKLGAIFNSMLEEKGINYRVSNPCIDNLKIGDNISFRFENVDGKTKKISVKEVIKKTDGKTDEKKTTSNTSNTSKKSNEKKADSKEVKEEINEKSVIEFLNSLKDFSFIIKWLESKGYSVTKK